MILPRKEGVILQGDSDLFQRKAGGDRVVLRPGRTVKSRKIGPASFPVQAGSVVQCAGQRFRQREWLDGRVLQAGTGIK
jgi:hypothetical protein